MSKEVVVYHAKVTDMLQKMLQQGDFAIVDINKQVHWKDNPNEPIWLTSKEDKTKKKLYIYDTSITDPEAMILNPLTETLTAGSDKLFFYNSLTNVLRDWVFRVLTYLIEEAVANKTDPSKVSDPKLVSLLTPIIGKVDSKTPEEIEKIRLAGVKDFCTIFYNRSKKTSTFLFAIEDEDSDYVKSFPASKVRKKTWTAITETLKLMFNVPSDKKIRDIYTCSTEKVECPYFITYSDVWIRAWECIDPYLDLYSGHVSSQETIESLKEHIKNAPVYRECTMWLKQPTSSSALVMPGSAKLAGQTTVQNNTPSWKTSVNDNANMIQLAPRPVVSNNTPSWMTSNYQGYSGMYQPNMITITRRSW